MFFKTMSSRILCIASEPVTAGWDAGDSLPDFELISCEGGLPGLPATKLEQFDAVLLTGSRCCEDAVDSVALVHACDATLPVVFWDPEMRATDAVRLARAGAYQALGYRDSMEALRDSLAGAAEHRRRALKARARASAVHEPWREFLVGQ